MGLSKVGFASVKAWARVRGRVMRACVHPLVPCRLLPSSNILALLLVPPQPFHIPSFLSSPTFLPPPAPHRTQERASSLIRLAAAAAAAIGGPRGRPTHPASQRLSFSANNQPRWRHSGRVATLPSLLDGSGGRPPGRRRPGSRPVPRRRRRRRPRRGATRSQQPPDEPAGAVADAEHAGRGYRDRVRRRRRRRRRARAQRVVAVGGGRQEGARGRRGGRARVVHGGAGRRGRRRRQHAEEAEAHQGAVRAPRGPIQGAQHPQPEAESRLGEATQPEATAGRGVVPKQASKDEAEADGGGLRVPQALLRVAHRGELPAAAGAAGAPRAQVRRRPTGGGGCCCCCSARDDSARALLHAAAGRRADALPVLRAPGRARRRQGRPRQAQGGGHPPLLQPVHPLRRLLIDDLLRLHACQPARTRMHPSSIP